MEIMGVELELLITAAAVIGGAIVWGLKKYKAMSADGKFTLDEIIDAASEMDKELDAVEEVVDKVLSAYKVSELKVMCKEKGLPVSGTKAELVARLEVTD